MDLTAWQRICNRILGRVVKKRARADKELSDNLVKGSMKMMPEVYLATAIMTTIAITLVCWGFGVDRRHERLSTRPRRRLDSLVQMMWASPRWISGCVSIK